MHLYLPIYKLKIFFYESDNNLPITKFVIRVIQIYNLIYYRTSRMGATIGDVLSKVFFFYWYTLFVSVNQSMCTIHIWDIGT